MPEGLKQREEWIQRRWWLLRSFHFHSHPCQRFPAGKVTLNRSFGLRVAQFRHDFSFLEEFFDAFASQQQKSRGLIVFESRKEPAGSLGGLRR